MRDTSTRASRLQVRTGPRVDTGFDARVAPLPCSTVSMRTTRSTCTVLQLAATVLNLVVWLLVASLTLLQLTGVFWSSMHRDEYMVFGQSPLASEPARLSGLNDEPLSDRAVVCVLQGRSYVPMSVNDALELATAELVDSTGDAINGYRVVQRASMVMSPDALAVYAHTCSVVASTLDAILQHCARLGYNVTHDKLRIVNGLNSSALYAVNSSLPVLMIPFSDNNFVGRFVVPGWDGSACMFRLAGKYSDVASPTPYAIAVNRSTREAKTAAWLKRPNGTWRNGWYEDEQGMKWFSDVISNEPDSTLGIALSQSDMTTGKRVACERASSECSVVLVRNWASKFSSNSVVVARTSIIIGNSKRVGFFQYRAHLVTAITSVYGYETFISNALTLQLLVRWMLAIVALHRGATRGVAAWHSAGVGCLANCPSFAVLPLVLLPRLKMLLFALCTAGCYFEGHQRALSDAWFVMYPTLVEVVLLYYSLLNHVAKLLHVRVSDALFGPSVIALCGLHWLREPLAKTRWLGGDGRWPALVSPEEFTTLTLLDFFTTDLIYRSSGHAQTIVALKLAVFSASLLPLVAAMIRRWWCRERHGAVDDASLSSGEATLALRIRNACGLGLPHTPRSSTLHIASESTTDCQRKTSALDSYELVRFGYVVFGGDAAESAYLISFDDWSTFTLVAPLPKLAHLWHHRVIAFPIDAMRERATIAHEPCFMNVDDARLQHLQWWDISARSIK